MKSNSEPDKIIKEVAEYIEKWQYNDNRIKAVNLYSNSESWDVRIANIKDAINSILVRKTAFVDGTFKYDERFKRINKFKADEILLDTEKESSIFISKSIKTFAKIILEPEYPLIISPPKGKVKAPLPAEIENTIHALTFCYFFYKDIIKRIKTLEIEAMIRIDTTFSTFMFYAGEIYKRLDSMGIREGNRVKNGKKAGSGYVKEWKKKVIEIYEDPDRSDQKTLTAHSCAVNLVKEWKRRYPEDVERRHGKRPKIRSTKSVERFISEYRKGLNISQT